MPGVTPARGDCDVDLSARSLLASARAQTGLRDVGDDGFEPRLDRIVTWLDARAHLDRPGRWAAYDQILELVVNRLRFVDDHARTPEIANERIERPTIVIGAPRAGTTLLHSLLALDPDARAPVFWEVARPSPPPSRAAPDDARIMLGHRDVVEFCSIVPRMMAAHPYWDRGAFATVECESFGPLDLRNTYPSSFFRIPVFVRVGDHPDVPGFYAFHRTMLKHLQLGAPARRWVLKGVQHMAHVDVLRATYPDAVLVFPHRDPLRVLGSVLELMATMIEGLDRRPIDRRSLGQALAAPWVANFRAAAASDLLDDDDVCHVRYGDVVADPVAAVRTIHERAGLPFTPAHEDAIQAWQADAANRPDRHGKFGYSLDDFALDVPALEEDLAPYRDRFDVPREQDARRP